MGNFFDFYDLPTDNKKIIFQKNRDVALHRRQTRWMHHELSTIGFFESIVFGWHPSDLFERQDLEDLGAIFENSWYHGGFPYYHDEEIHEKSGRSIRNLRQRSEKGSTNSRTSFAILKFIRFSSTNSDFSRIPRNILGTILRFSKKMSSQHLFF
jgi:hypothetical protein